MNEYIFKVFTSKIWDNIITIYDTSGSWKLSFQSQKRNISFHIKYTFMHTVVARWNCLNCSASNKLSDLLKISMWLGFSSELLISSGLFDLFMKMMLYKKMASNVSLHNVMRREWFPFQTAQNLEHFSILHLPGPNYFFLLCFYTWCHCNTEDLLWDCPLDILKPNFLTLSTLWS